MSYNGYKVWSQSDTSSSVASDRMPHFVMDYSLFRVAKYLRLLGYDSLCDSNIRQNQLIRIAARDGRTIVTCTPYLAQQAEQHNRRARRLREVALKEREAEADIEAKADGAAHSPHSPSSPKADHRGELLGYDSDGASIYSDSDNDDDDDGKDDGDGAGKADACSGAVESIITVPSQETPPPTLSSANGLTPAPEEADDYHDPDEQEVQVIMIPKMTSSQFMESVADVIRTAGLRFDLKRVFSRCVKCNVRLLEVPKLDVAGRVHDTVYRVYEEFTECPQCKKVFWGIDGQRVINYKSLRTLDHLQTVCRRARNKDGDNVAPDCNDDSSHYIRHFRSYPKRVKKSIMSFLAEEDLIQLESAFPALHEIIYPFREALRK